MIIASIHAVGLDFDQSTQTTVTVSIMSFVSRHCMYGMDVDIVSYILDSDIIHVSQ